MGNQRVFGAPNDGRTPRSDAAASGSGGSGGFVPPVDTIARASASRLVDLDATTFPDGALVFVRSVRDFFVLHKASALAADDITVADAVGGGQWLRKFTPSVRWLEQASWSIDPAAADDEGDGSGGDPLQSHAELGRRAMDQGREIPQDVVVTIVSDLPFSDPINIDIRLPNDDTLVRYVGTPTSVQTGTFTDVTALVSGTNMPAVEDTVSGFGAGLVGDRIRATTGAAAGSIAWLLRQDDANTMTTSVFQTTTKTAQPVTGLPTIVNPATNDDYEVERMTAIRLGTIHCTVPSDDVFGIVFDSVQIGDSDTDNVVVGLTSVLVVDSLVRNDSFDNATMVFTGSLFADFVGLSNASVAARACAVRDTGSLVPSVCALVLSDETTAMGAPLLELGAASVAVERNASAHDSPSSGLVLNPLLRVRSAAGSLIWGSGNTDFGINATGGQLYYDAATQPTVTGGTQDTRVGGINQPYAALPTFNGSNGAAIVDTPT